MTLLDTLVLDLAIVVFYLVYNFVFNVAYDRFFPVRANSRPQVVSNLGEAS